MATRMLRYLTAALAAGFVLSLAPATPASADEPGYRTKRVRTYAPPRIRTVVQPVRERVVVQPVRERVRTVVQPVRERVVHVPVVQVRTVERVRTRTRVICYDYTGRPFDCRTPAPVAPQPEPQPVVQVVPAAPQPVYYTCGGCAPAPQPVQVVYTAPATGCGGCAPAPQYYTTSCCAQTGAYHGGYAGGYYRAAPYRWAVRHARHAYKYGH